MPDFSSQLSQMLGNGSVFAFFLAWLGGFFTSFTPCIYPMIPITFSIIAKSSVNDGRIGLFKSLLIYFSGMITVYSGLGVIAGFSGLFFGQFYNNVWVNVFLAIVFIFWGVNMLGFFDINYPVINKFDASTPLSLFVMGLLSGVVYAPCGAPSMFVILTYISLKGNWFLGVISMFMFSIGLCSLLIIVAIMSHYAVTLPRPGKWMLYTKKLIGLAMIVIACNFLLKVFI